MMKLYTAEQIRAWDDYTIKHEPITSIDLMERAAKKCFDWLNAHFLHAGEFEVFCGMGNNGGDGLAIARMLAIENKNVTVYIIKASDKSTVDFETNLKRLKETKATIVEITEAKQLKPVDAQSIIIDAVFGTGLKRPLEGLAAQTVSHINSAKNTVVCIDVPSGLPAEMVDNYADYKEIVKAHFTLSFQIPKLSFLFAETGKYVGHLVVIDIRLSKEFQDKTPSDFYWANEEMARNILQNRNRFSHKGSYGHALLVGGSFGKAGAMLMASKACVKAGAGLTTAFVPRCAYIPLQTAVPEAMVESIQKEELLDFMPTDTQNYTAIGIGPGMGTQITTRDALDDFLAIAESDKLIIDADALNCLSLNFADRKKVKLPEGAILTPHPKEFDRMFGESKTSSERLQKQIEAAKKHKVYIVLKGTHTSIALPTGDVYFNSTGNPGMATGGSGDVLTGIITSLRAQGYNQQSACILGVYLHGLSGDMALAFESQESLSAVDLIGYLGKAFKALQA
jgi:ADP-dependent NAD(P)H-hydrate dehydratase / NAD(P)H-hydrate epimerase